PVAAAAPRVDWLPRGEWSCYLRGSFAIVRPPAGEPYAVFVDRDAVEFQLTDRAFWQARCDAAAEVTQALLALYKDEPYQYHEHSAGQTVAFLVAKLEARRRDLAPPAPQPAGAAVGFDDFGQTVQQGQAPGTAVLHTDSVSGTDAGGQQVQIIATVQEANGRLTEVKLEPAATLGAPPARR